MTTKPNPSALRAQLTAEGEAHLTMIEGNAYPQRSAIWSAIMELYPLPPKQKTLWVKNGRSSAPIAVIPAVRYATLFADGRPLHKEYDEDKGILTADEYEQLVITLAEAIWLDYSRTQLSEAMTMYPKDTISDLMDLKFGKPIKRSMLINSRGFNREVSKLAEQIDTHLWLLGNEGLS